MEWINDITQWWASEQVEGFLTAVGYTILGVVVLAFMLAIADSVNRISKDSKAITDLLRDSLNNQRDMNENLTALNKKLQTITDKDI